jgi:hypothetical protein
MRTFFYDGTGAMRMLRIYGCLYVFNAAITVWGSGWRSTTWIGWLVLALGFFQSPESGSAWNSPDRKLSSGLMFIGVSLLFLSLLR